MELKEGMYVRTKSGEIGKIRVIIDNMVFINRNQYYSTIEKASHNIIDLIEEGDYVNGYKVDFVQDGYVVFNHNHPYQINIYPKDIKSIVTKEQFESMSYKVGE